ncbi:MAG: hypothetical protein ACYC1K_00355 [Minisyncoccota bacterium]
MKALKNNMGALITIAVLLVLFFVYQSFFKPNINSVASGSVDQNVGQDVVALYTTLQAVDLDQNLFTTPAYKNLVDFSTVLQDQPKGRRNPFDLIGAQ